MKKIITKISAILLVTIILTGCSLNISTIRYKKLMEKLNNKETFILLVSDGSDKSEALEKTLDIVLSENGLEAYKIKSKRLITSQKNEIRNHFKLNDSSIVFINKGKETSLLSQVTDPLISKEDLKEVLINQGYINEKKEK